MRVISGFVTKDSFISNRDNVVSDFFEISPMALTYTRDKGEYQHGEYPGDILYIFNARATSSQPNTLLDQAIVKHVFTIVNAVVNYARTQLGVFNTDGLRAEVSTVYESSIVEFDFGSIVETTEVKLPEWLSWKDKELDPELQTEFHIWLNSSAFENQYTDYTITVVPPIDVIDELFANFTEVKSRIQDITVDIMMQRVQVAKGNSPETVTRLPYFKLYNRHNSEQYVEVPFGILIYGLNGDNIDAIKDALINYILNHTTHTQAEWEALIPDIFRRTEFMFFPRWDKISIPNISTLSCLYSSIYSPTEMMLFVQRNHPMSYTDDYIVDRSEVLPFDYKAITCAVVPGETNLEENGSLARLFPDYIPVGTMEYDFNRMSLKTREWALIVVEMLKYAEKANEFTTLRGNIRKVKRNNKLYLSTLYRNINYLVSVRGNRDA